MRAQLVFYRVVRAILVGFARLFWRVEIHGRHRLPDGPFVLSPVHRSNIDFLLASAVTTRRLRFMGKASIWKYEWLGKVFTALGAWPVNRGTPDREALRRCVDAIAVDGEPVVIFPEGTRRSGPVVEDLFEGAAYVAARTGVPIVPVGIGGSEGAMPRGSKLIRPVKVVLLVGPPIEVPTGEGGRVPRRAVREATELLQRELQALFDEAQQLAGTPNELPA